MSADRNVVGEPKHEGRAIIRCGVLDIGDLEVTGFGRQIIDSDANVYVRRT